MSNNKLSEEFNIEIEDAIVEIKTFKDILKEIKTIPNPALIVTAAIEKASIFIDIIHKEVVNGDYSPRNLEVASQLINTIIQSSTFLTSTEQLLFDNRLKQITSTQKDRELDIKEKGLEIKQLMDKKGDSGPNNLIITDHKSIMKFLSENNDNSHIECKEVPTEKEI